MFFKSKFIKMLIEENKKKDIIIGKLIDRLMSRNFGEFKQYDLSPKVEPREEPTYKPEFDDDLIGEIVNDLETE